MVLRKYKTNKIILKKDHAELIIYSADKKKKFVSLIDLEDVPIVEKHSWCIRSGGYVGRVENKELILLHRLLVHCPKEKIVDHVNKNKIDNRKVNLRICNYRENLRNSIVKSNNSSSVTGVGIETKSKKWRARICVNYKPISLGFYNDKNDAIKARLKAEKMYFKEFAPQKHLFEKYNI